MNALAVLFASLVAGQPPPPPPPPPPDPITEGPCRCNGILFPQSCVALSTIPRVDPLDLCLKVDRETYTVVGFIIEDPNSLPTVSPAQSFHLGNGKWRLHWNDGTPDGEDPFVRIEVWDFSSGAELKRQLDLQFESKGPFWPPHQRRSRLGSRFRGGLLFGGKCCPAYFPVQSASGCIQSVLPLPSNEIVVAKDPPTHFQPKPNQRFTDMEPGDLIPGRGTKALGDHVFGFSIRFKPPEPQHSHLPNSNPDVMGASRDSAEIPLTWRLLYSVFVEGGREHMHWVLIEPAENDGKMRHSKTRIFVTGRR